MRKRQWVLYRFSFNKHFGIVRDNRTPLYEFRHIDHCYGVFKTRNEAVNEALKRLKYERNELNKQIRALEKTKDGN